MTAQRLTCAETQESLLPPAVVTHPVAVPDLAPVIPSVAMWAQKADSLHPRSTISGMWASSLVWAAGSLVDLVAITVHNVISGRRQ